VNAAPRRRRLAPYVAAARLAVRDQATGWADAIGRVAFLAVLLFIFSSLWRHVPMGDAAADPRSLLWYLAITEWVFLSVPAVHLTLERDVRSGDVAYRLPRPVSYLGMRIAEALGSGLVRFGMLGVAAMALAALLSGGLPPRPLLLFATVPLALAAMVLCLLAQAAVGATAAWVDDVSPIYWVWQKCAFVLGGLIVPLHLYPAWLRDAIAWTPFAVLLNGPARTAFAPDAPEVLRIAALLLFWIVVFAWLARAVHRKSLASLGVHGG
jgi:ABC-2 type transport system permease protein